MKVAFSQPKLVRQDSDYSTGERLGQLIIYY